MGGYDQVYADFSVGEATFVGRRKRVFRLGDGPPVIIMTEVPGITPKVFEFARRVAARGMTVVLPDLFGVAGRPPSLRSGLAAMGRACISREFAVLARHRASPVTEWLRALGRSLHEEHGGPVGAVGMCLTGNFAITLALDPWLMAPVLSQPSLPAGLGASKRALHATPEACASLRRRAREDGLSVLGLRFTGDPLCPPQRFAALAELLGEQFEAIEIESGSSTPHRRAAHSVLTEDLIDEEGQPTYEALQRVLGFLEERLLPRESAS